VEHGRGAVDEKNTATSTDSAVDSAGDGGVTEYLTDDVSDRIQQEVRFVYDIKKLRNFD